MGNRLVVGYVCLNSSIKPYCVYKALIVEQTFIGDQKVQQLNTLSLEEILRSKISENANVTSSRVVDFFVWFQLLIVN